MVTMRIAAALPEGLCLDKDLAQIPEKKAYIHPSISTVLMKWPEPNLRNKDPCCLLILLGNILVFLGWREVQTPCVLAQGLESAKLPLEPWMREAGKTWNQIVLWLEILDLFKVILYFST